MALVCFSLLEKKKFKGSFVYHNLTVCFDSLRLQLLLANYFNLCLVQCLQLHYNYYELPISIQLRTIPYY